jgi:hypothetical protein
LAAYNQVSTGDHPDESFSTSLSKGIIGDDR